MRKRIGFSSITKEQARNNDDFLLYSDTELTTLKKGFFCPFDFVYDKDLSISFVIQNAGNVPGFSTPIIYSSIGDDSRGSGILFNGSIVFYRRPTAITLVTPSEFKINGIYHIVLNYKFSTNSF